MTTQNESKLKTLFQILRPGHVVTASWLEKLGISRNLKKYYLESAWLEPLGRGAYKKPGDNIEWQGALNAIQKQSKIQIHVGGLSALSLQGYSHYFRLNNETLHLFSPVKTKLPKWFSDYNWNYKILHKHSNFLPNDIALMEVDIKSIPVSVSTPERAIMECLLLAPKVFDLLECYHLFEGLVNLKPKLISELLINCSSIKVKRLFLYMAEKVNHQWFQFLKTDNFNLGKGNRMLAENGVYCAKYLISIPKELAQL
ncbi:MAG: type IV toxin-antitoxin system AbiEi family antitoxin [Bacteroidota bacterium]|nr:type IV toxin-antitoxin system AbiEi family antitoxin [Bacteroidota bacterium]